MSKFQVPVRRIEHIGPHPNAARLELARISGFRVVLKKGEHQVGDLVALLPEQSLVPQWLLQAIGRWDEAAGKGRLAGPAGNRVHPVELRGVLSMALPVKGVQHDGGLLLRNPEGEHCFREGEDVHAFLGCTKYIPQVPAELSGDSFPLELRLAARFDVEDVHHHPHIFTPGEEVVFLEKVHGVFTGLGDVSEEDATPHGRRILVSKGLADSGLAFVPKAHWAQQNIYQQATHELAQQGDRWQRLREALGEPNLPVWVLGETFGGHVQDLHYGVPLEFMGFALAVGYRYDLRYIDYDVAAPLITEVLGLRTPKVLYRGPYDLPVLERACRGKEQVSGQEWHMREGGVLIPVKERKHSDLETGRVALKCVSPEYSGRPNGTEYR